MNKFGLTLLVLGVASFSVPALGKTIFQPNPTSLQFSTRFRNTILFRDTTGSRLIKRRLNTTRSLNTTRFRNTIRFHNKHCKTIR